MQFTQFNSFGLKFDMKSKYVGVAFFQNVSHDISIDAKFDADFKITLYVYLEYFSKKIRKTAFFDVFRIGA